MKLRKFISSFMALLLTLVFLGNNSFAKSLDSTVKNENGTHQLLYQEDITFTSHSDGTVSTKTKPIKNENLRKNVKEKLKKERNKLKEKFTEAESVNSELIGAQSTSGRVVVGVVTIRHSISSNNVYRTITHGFEITSVIGVPPVQIYAFQELKYGETKGWLFGWYHNSMDEWPEVTWIGPQIKVGAKLSETIPAQTKWWGYFGGATAYYANGTYSDTDWDSESDGSYGVLINKTGNPFPDYLDTHTGRWASGEPGIMVYGVSTSWTKVANPIPPMTSTERGAYIRQYIDTYGDPHRDWSLYDIHHIQPREYGGTNAFDNLIPVLRNPNHYNITGWFKGY